MDSEGEGASGLPLEGQGRDDAGRSAGLLLGLYLQVGAELRMREEAGGLTTLSCQVRVQPCLDAMLGR